MSEITPLLIQVALRVSPEQVKLFFSSRWLVPHLVVFTSAGKMALINLTFLVADDETACEDILIGLPVLRHLSIYSSTLVEEQWNYGSTTSTDLPVEPWFH